jgi:hypothetical protein
MPKTFVLGLRSPFFEETFFVFPACTTRDGCSLGSRDRATSNIGTGTIYFTLDEYSAFGIWGESDARQEKREIVTPEKTRD